MTNRGSQLSEYINSLGERRFSELELNCAHVAGKWVEQRTGGDLLSDWDHLLVTHGSAARALVAAGFASLEEAVDACSGLQRVALPEARRGDVALVGGQGWLGIVDRGDIVGLGDSGLVRVSLTDGVAFWRVG